MENVTIHFQNEVSPINNIKFNCPLVTEIAHNLASAILFKYDDRKEAARQTTIHRIESMQDINDKIGGKWDELDNAKKALEKFDELFDQLSVSNCQDVVIKFAKVYGDQPIADLESKSHIFPKWHKPETPITGNGLIELINIGERLKLKIAIIDGFAEIHGSAFGGSISYRFKL